MLHKKNRKNKSPIVQYAESPGGGGRVRRPQHYRGRRAGWAQAWHTLTNNINNIKFIFEAKVFFKDYSFLEYPDQDKAKKMIKELIEDDKDIKDNADS